MILARTFADNLKREIKSRRIPLKVIEHSSGYSSNYIRRVYNNAGERNPTLSFVEAMAQALDVSVPFLLGYVDE